MLFDPKWQRHEAKTLADIFAKGRALIENPANWCQGMMYDGDAVCAIGAINRAQGLPPSSCTEAQAVMGKMVGMYLGDFNDTHTHAEVLAAFDRAIEAARAKL